MVLILPHLNSLKTVYDLATRLEAQGKVAEALAQYKQVLLNYEACKDTIDVQNKEWVIQWLEGVLEKTQALQQSIRKEPTAPPPPPISQTNLLPQPLLPIQPQPIAPQSPPAFSIPKGWLPQSEELEVDLEADAFLKDFKCESSKVENARQIYGLDPVINAAHRVFCPVELGPYPAGKKMLLWGPPGCGKTSVVRYIARHFGIENLFEASASRLKHSLAGQSEKAIRKLFEKAKGRIPSIVFLDEVDSISTERGSSSETEHGRSLKTEFLQVLTDVDSWDITVKVLVVAAMNKAWEMDPAIRKRFADNCFFVDLPEEQTRVQIFKEFLGLVQHDMDDDQIAELGKLTEGYTGADIDGICRKTMNRIRDQMRECQFWQEIVSNNERLLFPLLSSPKDQLLSRKALHTISYEDAVKGEWKIQLPKITHDRLKKEIERCISTCPPEVHLEYVEYDKISS